MRKYSTVPFFGLDLVTAFLLFFFGFDFAFSSLRLLSLPLPLLSLPLPLLSLSLPPSLLLLSFLSSLSSPSSSSLCLRPRPLRGRAFCRALPLAQVQPKVQALRRRAPSLPPAALRRYQQRCCQ